MRARSGDDAAMKLALTPIIRTLPGHSDPAYNRFMVTADFEREDGRAWTGVGGGETISEALASARADLGPDWEIVRWNHAFG